MPTARSASGWALTAPSAPASSRRLAACWPLRAQAPIVHLRVGFRPDGADILQNGAIFRAVAASGAVQEGSWGAAFFDSLAPESTSPREWVVKHSRINAFYGSPLDEALRACGAERLVMAGVATHSVVESTVRHAADMGFDVWVATDACAAADPAVHAASLASMQLIATLATVEACLASKVD